MLFVVVDKNLFRIFSCMSYTGVFKRAGAEEAMMMPC